MPNPFESMGLNLGQENIAKMEVDEKPMYESRFEEYSKALFGTLDQITPEDIKGVRDFISQHPEGNEELSLAVDSISRLKALQDKQGVLDRLARRNVYELDSAKLKAPDDSRIPKSVGNAIHQLAIACEALAQARFPEEYSNQEQWAKNDRARETEEMKRNSQGFKIS